MGPTHRPFRHARPMTSAGAWADPAWYAFPHTVPADRDDRLLVTEGTR